MRGERGQASRVDFFNCGNPLEDRLALENAERRIRRGAGDWIGGVGVPVEERARAIAARECVVNAIGRKRRGQWQKSAGQSLGDAHQIGNDCGSFAGEHSARSAEAGEDFVRNQQHIVSGGQAADSGKKFLGMNDHPARALKQRLDNHGGDFIALLGKQALQFVQAFDLAGCAREADRAVRAVGRMRAQDRNSQGIERRGEWRIVAHRHRAHRIAVVGVFERDDFLFPRPSAILPILQGQLQRDFHRGRAVIREKNVAQRRGNNFAQARRKLFGRLVRKSREEDVFEPRGLFGDGLRDGRMRVAVNVDPPGRNRVQNLAPVLRLNKNAFAAANGKWRRVHAFLRERMPEMEIGSAHNLLECLMIEMFFIDVKQRRAINFLEHGDVANDANIAVMLDGAAILDVLVADERHTANREARFAQRGKRQQRVIDRPERRARGNDDWESDSPA